VHLVAARPLAETSLTDPMKDTEVRIAWLDEAGITVRVLSYPYAGADLLAPREGRRWWAAGVLFVTYATDPHVPLANHRLLLLVNRMPGSCQILADGLAQVIPTDNSAYEDLPRVA
jgi:hypothetical protein